jgi:hypothetical protein
MSMGSVRLVVACNYPNAFKWAMSTRPDLLPEEIMIGSMPFGALLIVRNHLVNGVSSYTMDFDHASELVVWERTIK